jgi:hypothetical protein
MKTVIMEQTMVLMFPRDTNGNYVIPEEYEPRTTEDGINYIIKEENE